MAAALSVASSVLILGGLYGLLWLVSRGKWVGDGDIYLGRTGTVSGRLASGAGWAVLGKSYWHTHRPAGAGNRQAGTQESSTVRSTTHRWVRVGLVCRRAYRRMVPVAVVDTVVLML